ncbi:alpha/beta fold hydrolase [Streptomyces botrytidirepellens]|uniref:Alpha/beta fold hydrolase n=1 Tax=Streptomyces botrytidirepellens TaxID=2486417 RepID=A0A3M8TPI1_9ACTN|nr:alpha/beta hydrolase [Streptomyces botrytidirepellens]RNF92762.1 alpha/beta fold hydrolase [Streptomyces botrytidirepellens]
MHTAHRHTAYVEAAPGVRLWTEQRGPADAPALLLVMGAQAAGLGWPEPFVDALAEHHRVIRYDHRDTGRSSWSYEQDPYRIADLAEDVVAVLDGLGVERAHLVGMSLGGILTQLVLADHPERVLSATLLGTAACSTTPYVAPDGTRVPVEELPGVDPRILEEWARPVEDHGLEAELDRRVRHWKLLNGDHIPFDADWFRELERGIIEHTGRYDTSGAHARADQSGLVRTDALAATEVPTLVLAPTAEPVFPLPHPQHLAQVIGGARLVEIPGMGHALPPAVLGPLADAILGHTRTAG